MKFLNKSFTVATGIKSDKKWDYAFLKPEEFKNKYNVSDEEYKTLKENIYD